MAWGIEKGVDEETRAGQGEECYVGQGSYGSGKVMEK